MTVSAIRYRTLGQLKAAGRNAHFVKFTHSRDENGFFFETFEQHPVAVARAAELDARARANPAPIAPKAEVERKARVVKDDGPCGQIRAWVRENPNATRDEAIAQFPSLNRNTVAIQYRKVKIGAV